ncbi:MAG: DUF3488 and transglutaminase-like domain-containing protein [Proteobacteria bacterium]|nr:DUF3488 and transglutaminase-like domain-containing protein [Pseudomonadota bacterium]
MQGSPLPLLLYFFLTILIFFSLMLHHLPPSAAISLWPLGRNILKIAAPVSAILLPIYFFFPEMRPNANESAVSGISDLLEPGSIASLSLSDRMAFRVRFHNELPAEKSLYWRVSVLEDSYGMIWRKSRDTSEEAFTQVSMPSALQYELMTDAKFELHLPLLEHTLALKGVGEQPSAIWWIPRLRSFRSQNSILLASTAPLDRYLPKIKPSVPKLTLRVSDRIQNLVMQLRKMSPDQQVKMLLELMSHFQYTLEPGTLSHEDALDDFIFVKKQGFCEHFAAAFASLLQLADTPARVVLGYEGGAFLGASEFMIVRDSDAHAWTEVFIDDRWQRIDPSSVAINNVRPKIQRLWITHLPAAWLSYVIRLASIALKEWTSHIEDVWLILICSSTLIVPIQIWRLRKRRRLLPAWHKQLKAFLRNCEQKGLSRHQHEGMQDFLKRLANRIPDLKEDILKMSQLYQKVVYGFDSQATEADQLSSQFKKIRRQIQKHSDSPTGKNIHESN